jgi:fructose-1-phosphate kinase PfkB-like protein
MMGGLAYCMAAGLDWDASLRLSAAAGAANFLRRGLGSGTRETVEELARRVDLAQLQPSG